MGENLDGEQAFRSTQLAGRDREMAWGGAISFLRRNYTRDLDEADIVVTGIPFDMATSIRPGAAAKPKAETPSVISDLPDDQYPIAVFDGPPEELAELVPMDLIILLDQKEAHGFNFALQGTKRLGWFVPSMALWRLSVMYPMVKLSNLGRTLTEP
jgi:hypothetical protein